MSRQFLITWSSWPKFLKLATPLILIIVSNTADSRVSGWLRGCEFRYVRYVWAVLRKVRANIPPYVKKKEEKKNVRVHIRVRVGRRIDWNRWPDVCPNRTTPPSGSPPSTCSGCLSVRKFTLLFINDCPCYPYWTPDEYLRWQLSKNESINANIYSPSTTACIALWRV